MNHPNDRANQGESALANLSAIPAALFLVATIVVVAAGRVNASEEPSALIGSLLAEPTASRMPTSLEPPPTITSPEPTNLEFQRAGAVEPSDSRWKRPRWLSLPGRRDRSLTAATPGSSWSIPNNAQPPIGLELQTVSPKAARTGWFSRSVLGNGVSSWFHRPRAQAVSPRYDPLLIRVVPPPPTTWQGHAIPGQGAILPPASESVVGWHGPGGLTPSPTPLPMGYSGAGQARVATDPEGDPLLPEDVESALEPRAFPIPIAGHSRITVDSRSIGPRPVQTPELLPVLAPPLHLKEADQVAEVQELTIGEERPIDLAELSRLSSESYPIVSEPLQDTAGREARRTSFDLRQTTVRATLPTPPIRSAVTQPPIRVPPSLLMPSRRPGASADDLGPPAILPQPPRLDPDRPVPPRMEPEAIPGLGTESAPPTVPIPPVGPRPNPGPPPTPRIDPTREGVAGDEQPTSPAAAGPLPPALSSEGADATQPSGSPEWIAAGPTTPSSTIIGPPGFDAPAMLPARPPSSFLMESLGLAESPVRIHGFLNPSFFGNTDGTPADGLNRGVRPQRLANQFMGNQFALFVTKPLRPDYEEDWGFTITNLLGQDAALTRARGFGGGPSTSSSWGNYDLLQVYGEYRAPVPGLGSRGLELKGGRFLSPLGYESILAPGRPLPTWSYQRAFAQPATLFGFLSTMHIGENLQIYNGAVNGWDRWVNENYRWGYVGGFRWSSGTGTFLSSMVISGPNQFPMYIPGGTPSGYLPGEVNRQYKDNRRSLFVTTLTHRWSENLTQAIETTQAWEAKVPGLGSEGSQQNAEWYGFSHYLHWDASPRLSATWRFEIFRDDDGARTGVADTFYESSLGLTYKPRPWFWLRPEARFDWAQFKTPFQDGTRGSQVLIGLDAILLY